MVVKTDLDSMLDESGVCVSRPPVSTPCLNYELVGFQHQAVDISDLGSVHTPSEFSIPPTSKIHDSNKTKLTKDRQWAHLLANSVVSGSAPINLGSYVLQLFFKPK